MTMDLNLEDLKNKIAAGVLPRLMNAGAPGPEDVFSTPFLDMKIEYHLPMEVPVGKGNAIGSIVFTKANLDALELSPEYLHFRAIVNLAKVVDRIQPVSEVLGKAGHPDPYAPEMYVIHLKNELRFGAAALLMKSIMQKMSTICEGDFFIIPSSVHEILCLKTEDEQTKAFFIKSMIKAVNRSEVEPDDVLSDNLYVYRAKTETIEIYGGDPDDPNNSYKY